MELYGGVESRKKVWDDDVVLNEPQEVSHFSYTKELNDVFLLWTQIKPETMLQFRSRKIKQA